MDTTGNDKTMEYIAGLVCGEIEKIGPEKIVAVCMDGACKGAFPLITQKYPWMQCYTCLSHGIDLFLKNACSDKAEIQMQANVVGGVRRQEVSCSQSPVCVCVLITCAGACMS